MMIYLDYEEPKTVWCPDLQQYQQTRPWNSIHHCDYCGKTDHEEKE